MTLHIKNQRGIEIQLTPVRATRIDLLHEHGETFTLPGSDMLYHIHEVYAKPSPDTTIAAVIMVMIFTFFVAQSMYITIFSGLAIAIISQLFFYFDKKAVKKFNESTTF